MWLDTPPSHCALGKFWGEHCSKKGHYIGVSQILFLSITCDKITSFVVGSFAVKPSTLSTSAVPSAPGKLLVFQVSVNDIML